MCRFGTSFLSPFYGTMRNSLTSQNASGFPQRNNIMSPTLLCNKKSKNALQRRIYHKLCNICYLSLRKHKRQWHFGPDLEPTRSHLKALPPHFQNTFSTILIRARFTKRSGKKSKGINVGSFVDWLGGGKK